jgi:type I restriction enzyme R subunit
VFDSVIVITDRTVLDDQLQETIYQFEHAEGVVCRISREEGEGSKSAQLAQALADSTRIIIVTIQTFPFVLEAIQQQANLKHRRFAVIADEAHSSQTGATARKVREVLMAEQLDEEAEITGEDVLDATLALAVGYNISYWRLPPPPRPRPWNCSADRTNLPCRSQTTTCRRLSTSTACSRRLKKSSSRMC